MIANARMYSVNAETAAAWHALLEWVIARAGVAATVINYPAPQPLTALWARDDLAGAFMCGHPLSQATPRPIVLAAPIPAMPRCAGAPVYWTDIVVRADSAITTIEDTFGKRFGYTTPDSQPGYQAPRYLLAPYANARGGRLFSATVGPLVTPRRVIEAVLAGDCDAGPVDSYALELFRSTEPDFVSPLRVIASTAITPIPALIASSTIDSESCERLADAFRNAGDADELADARGKLRLTGFARPAAADYDVLRLRAREADQLGYSQLA